MANLLSATGGDYGSCMLWLVSQAERGHCEWVDAAIVLESRRILPSVCCGTDFQTAAHVRQELLLPDVFEACQEVRSSTLPPE